MATTVLPGATFTVTGSVANEGSAAADGVRLTYAVTAGFTVESVSAGTEADCVAVSPQQITCTFLTPLAPSSIRHFTLQATAGAEAGIQTHLVAATSPGSEPAPDPHPNLATFRTQVWPEGVPVPLRVGGPYNFLGTGPLVGTDGTSGFASEGVYLAVNPYCTDKANGDRYQSATDGGTCSGTPNAEYRDSGYQYDIEVPPGRTSSVVVRLWDPQYDRRCLGAVTYSDWRKADATSGYDTYDPPLTQEGPGLRYWNGTVWVELAAGESATAIYWQTAYSTTCAAGVPDGPIDNYRQQGPEPYTFTLYSADSTPDDDFDNPPLCSQTFTPDTPYDGYSFLGSARWNTLCTISTVAPAGRYFLRVRNSGTVTSPEGDGSNQFGIVATYAAAGTEPAAALCDSRTDPLCPRVSGSGGASIRVEDQVAVLEPYLAQVPATASGKVLRIQLFDPGEGGQSIGIQAPTGTDAWAPMAFRWSASGVGSGVTTQLDVTNSRFNGKLVTIEVDLTGYEPPADNEWWKIRYSFSQGTVADRTTWDVAVVGQPPAPLGASTP